MKKRLIGIVLVLYVLCSLVQCVQAATIVDSGTCGDNLIWMLDDNGILTISGNGDMENYNHWNKAPWYYNNENIVTVKINSGILSIGDEAFYYCRKLSSITISDSVTAIGDSAFYDCESLESIKMSNNITDIGEYAFYDCEMLNNIEIPNSVNHIGEYAFLGCDNLINVSIPEKTTAIGAGAFACCNNLTDITVSLSNPNYKSIDGVLFSKDGKNILQYPAGKDVSYTIPNGVTEIGEDAFHGCTNIESVAIPDTVTYISDGAFALCCDLSEISIPYGVTYIGGSAFEQCGFTSIVIPGSVETIRWFAFDHSKLEKITIENGVKNIEEEAFNGCDYLEEIFIPASVENIGINTFGWCHHLTAINVAKTNRNYQSTDGVLFTKDGKTLMQYPAGKGISYIVPENVTKIEERAFYGCEGLKDIQIPISVSYIENSSFYYCKSLADIYYNGTQSQWEKIEKRVSFDGVSIHYASSMPAQINEPDINNIEITKNNNTYQFDVEIDNIASSCRLIVAVYKNHKVVDVKSIPIPIISDYSDHFKTITAIADNPDSAKIFIWDNFASMKPLCETMVIPIG